MNWAKKLLQLKNAESALPSHDCPRCGGRLIDEGDTVHCDTCDYPEPEDDEDGHVVCDVCGRVIDDTEYATCPVCGVALCGDEECADKHIAEHHPEWDEDDEDDEDDVCAVCGEILASGHPTCPCCATPLCGNKGCYDAHMAEHRREWRGEDTDGDEPSGRCDDCEHDGDCGHCPGHPGYTKPNPF